MNITIVYTVGGEDRHYKNLEKSIRSLERLAFKPNIHVYDMNRLGIEVSNELAWRSKYEACLQASGDIIWYIDTDMVVVQDYIEETIENLAGRFGLPRHWYIDDTYDYCVKSCPNPEYTYLVIKDFLKFGNSAFPAAGTFIYENNTDNRNILNSVLDLYKTLEKYDIVKNKITDELILNCAAECTLHSAFNYSFMLGQSMIETLNDKETGNLLGGSQFESTYSMIVLGHCDVFRRDPSKFFQSDRYKNIIRNLFYLETK